MNIEIKRLTPELVGEYIDFFEKVAFTDNQEWAGCYCVWYHLSEELEEERKKYAEAEGTSFNRELAIRMIKERTLRGYLAYVDGSVAGWCNANDKAAYSSLSKAKAPELWSEEHETMKTIMVVCYTIAPNMRRQGIASKLLEQVCSDAKTDGYDCVEAFPGKSAENVHRNYHGPYLLYEKQGFTPLKELEYMTLVRKYLQTKSLT